MTECARQILDSADSLEEIVKQEVGRRMAEHLRPVQRLLHDIQREVNKAQNHITALGVGYEYGSLLKKEKT